MKKKCGSFEAFCFAVQSADDIFCWCAVHVRLLKAPHGTAFTNQTLLLEWFVYSTQELAPHFSCKIEKNRVLYMWNQWFLCSAQTNMISSWFTSCALYFVVSRSEQSTWNHCLLCTAQKSCFLHGSLTEYCSLQCTVYSNTHEIPFCCAMYKDSLFLECTLTECGILQQHQSVFWSKVRQFPWSNVLVNSF